MATELPTRPISQLVAATRSGELSARELVDACLGAIAAREDVLQAWVHLDPELARTQAERLDALPADERGPLHGLPVGVKDIIDTADQPTQHGSPVYAGNQPSADATCVARLREAGAVVLGKTVTTEFAGFHPGPTTNPHDPSRTPGGSSSGSAAAVGAGTVPLALGTQTAGSIVRPASFCGVVGAKPTFDRVPADGVKPFSPSLDTVGTFTHDAAGATLALAVLTGEDPMGPAATAPGEGPAPRLGFARTPEWDRLPGTTRTAVEDAAARLGNDLDVVEVELPAAFDGLVEAQMALMMTEATEALARERRDHAAQLSSRLRDGLRVGDRHRWAVDAARAHVERCRALLSDVFEGIDALLAPAVLGEAPPLEEGTGDPLLCRSWTALGTPAVAVPGLVGPDGLPLGVQVIAPRGADATALDAVAHVQPRLAGRGLLHG